MKLYLDTSAPTTVIKFDDQTYEWESGHNLARDLLKFIHDKLEEQGKDWPDLTEITFMSGPGSFTGLRIGATVVNTLADQLIITAAKKSTSLCPNMVDRLILPLPRNNLCATMDTGISDTVEVFNDFNLYDMHLSSCILIFVHRRKEGKWK